MSSSVKNVDYAIYRIRVSDYRVLEADKTFQRITGYTEEDYKKGILKQTDLIPGSDIVEYLENIRSMGADDKIYLEHRLKRKDGSVIVVFCYGIQYTDEKTKEHMAQIMITDISNITDIASIKADDRSYMVMSEHDTLTGLYNRGAFEKRVNEELVDSDTGMCSMTLIDINNLKYVNQKYGTHIGDYIINHMATELVAIFKSDVLLSRTGGDEFCIYNPMSERGDLQKLYNKRIMEAAENIAFPQYPDVSISVSIGTAHLRRKIAVFEVLYGKAEQALRQAKLADNHCAELFNIASSTSLKFSGSLLVVTRKQKVIDSINSVLGTKYHILYADSSSEAIDMIDREKESIQLLLTDMYDVKISGFELLDYMRKMDYITNIPVVFLSKEYMEDVYKNAFAHGVIDIVTEPFDTYSLGSRLNNIIDLYRHKNALEEKTVVQHEKIQKMNENIIEYLGNIVEFRDTESGSHIKRVKIFTQIIAQCVMKQCPEYNLNQHKVDMIVQVSPLHDVGKIAIPDKILLKPGKLTAEEFEVIKQHTVKGYDIIMQIFDDADPEYKKYCSDIARYHHEKYDGKGYPDGLVGDDIPIGAQIVALADVYDALVSKRCYKDKYSFETAYEMINNGECGIFNDKILKCFAQVRSDVEMQAELLRD